METTVLKVEGMSCQHCVKAVTAAVTEMDGISKAEVNLSAKTVTVTHDPALSGVKAIRDAIEDAGYEVVG